MANYVLSQLAEQDVENIAITPLRNLVLRKQKSKSLAYTKHFSF